MLNTTQHSVKWTKTLINDFLNICNLELSINFIGTKEHFSERVASHILFSQQFFLLILITNAVIFLKPYWLDNQNHSLKNYFCLLSVRLFVEVMHFGINNVYFL